MASSPREHGIEPVAKSLAPFAPRYDDIPAKIKGKQVKIR